MQTRAASCLAKTARMLLKPSHHQNRDPLVELVSGRGSETGVSGGGGPDTDPGVGKDNALPQRGVEGF